MKITQYNIKLTGATPLILHHDDIDWADYMDEWRKQPANRAGSKAGDDRSPAWRWIGCVYSDGQKLTIPSDNLMALIRDGAKRVPTGKRGGSFKSQSQSGIIVDAPNWTLLNGDSKEVSLSAIEALREEDDFKQHAKKVRGLGFRLFVKRAKIGASKHIRVRPCFDQWSCSGTITIVDSNISESVVSDIWTHAGAYAGLCDWRPGSPKSPGPYGKFTSVVERI